MQDASTNLLPPERMRGLSRQYLLRLCVVACILATVLVVAAGTLLIPTYVLLSSSAHAKQSRLVSIETSLASSDEKALSARLSALSNDAATLVALASAPSASASVRSVLGVPRSGITLVSLAYTAPQAKTPATIAIAGTAATRDALRNYQLALQGSSFITSANLPVSAFAQDSDINFTITVTLSP